MVETTKFVRVPLIVEGVQVTEENLEAVADWCGGDIRTVAQSSDERRYVKVKVHHPLNDRQTRAYPGDWILQSPTGFRIYTNNAFLKTFIPAEV